MIKDTYKSLFDKIEPSQELINTTKEKMKKEKIKKKFSFYKLGTIAACLIIALVITIPYTKTSNTLESCDSVHSFDSAMTGSSNITNSAPNQSFDTSNSIYFETGKSVNSAVTEKVEEKSFIEKILDWIKTLLD